MLVLTIAITADEVCGTPNYTRVLHKQDSAFQFTISQAGAQKFIDCGFQAAVSITQQIVIPDMVFAIDLGVTKMQFTLRDMMFLDFNVEKIDLSFDNIPYVSAAADNADITITFQWGFQQTSYPYLTDSGSGTLLLDGVRLSIKVTADTDYVDCPGHLVIKEDRADLKFDTVKLKLEGGSSWIYQSLIDILIDQIAEVLSSSMSDVLVEGIEDLMRKQMSASTEFLFYDGFNDTAIADDRIVAPWEVGYGWLGVRGSGYVYEYQHLEDEYIDRERALAELNQDVTMNKYNNELVFVIHKAALDNAFYIF